MQTIRQLIILSLVLWCSSCGSSGGGGGGFDELVGADLEMSVRPTTIGVGERTRLDIELRRIHIDGVVVVVRYSAGALDYVSGSAELEVDGENVFLNPTFGPANRANWDYVTFYLSRDAFDDENSGVLSLQLRGERRNSDAMVEVDQFVHDPSVPPESEFSLSDPDFSADDSENIDVIND